MPLARAALTILFALILLGDQASAQRNDRVHELAEKALAVIRESNEEEFQSRLLSDVALILARNGEQESAYEVFQEALEKVPENDSSCQLSDVAERMAKAEFYSESIRLANSIRRDEQYSEDDANYCFMAIAWQLAADNELERATATCFEIRDEYCRALALADTAVAAMRRSEKAIADRLVRLTIFNSNQIKSLSMRLGAIEQIVEILEQGQMREVAQQLATHEADNANESGRAWGSVMSMEATLGNVDGVKRAGAKWIIRDGSVSNWTHFSMGLAEAQARAGFPDEARETAKAVAEYKYYELTAGHVAEAFIKAGRLNDALDMIETISQSERARDSMTYGQTLLELAAAHFKNGDEEKAKELLNKSRQHVQAMELALYRSDFATVGQAHGELGFDAEYEAWANSLESPYAKATALIGLGNGILKRSKTPK